MTCEFCKNSTAKYCNNCILNKKSLDWVDYTPSFWRCFLWGLTISILPIFVVLFLYFIYK